MELDKILNSIEYFFNTTPKDVIEEIEKTVSALDINDITIEEYLNSMYYSYTTVFDEKENSTSAFVWKQENVFENIEEILVYNQTSFKESISKNLYSKATTIEEICSPNTIKWFNVA